MINGIDLSDATVGDRIDLPHHDAELLIAEGWAEPAAPPAPRGEDVRSVAPDRGPSRKHRSKRS